MEKTVKSCGECLFHQGDPLYNGWFNQLRGYCDHPNGQFFTYMGNPSLPIHPNCPEKGAFIITTKKIEDETTTI